MLDGEVVDAHRRRRPREELLDAGGTLEGGIVPKLGAAIAAARHGVTALRSAADGGARMSAPA